MDFFDVAVIGAGVCGLTVAHALTDAGSSVVLLDKARRPGGRLSSHKLGGTLLDTAATSLESDDPGAIAEFARRTGSSPGDFDAPAGEVAARWAAGLDPREAFVLQLAPQAEGIAVVTEVSAASVLARTVVVTTPVPQAHRMLAASGITMPDHVVPVSYSRQLVLLCEVDRREAAVQPGLFARARWHEREDGATVELFATTEWSESAWNDDVTLTHAAMLLEAAREYPGVRVRRSAVKRWRYAERRSAGSAATFVRLPGNGVLLAGDGFGDGHPEHGLSRAVRSGLDTAAAVLTR